MKKLKTKLLMYVMVTFLTLGSVPVMTQPVTVEAKTTYVYIAASGKGKCYHSKKKCSRMKKVKKMTISKAKKKGYRACKKCYR